MAIIEYYVNIDNSYTTAGAGLWHTPYNWDQFLVVLSAAIGSESSSNNKQFYLSGSRVIDQAADLILEYGAWDSVTLTSYPDAYNSGQEPWRISYTGNTGYGFFFKPIETDKSASVQNDADPWLQLSHGLIDTDQANINMGLIYSMSVINCQNMWFKCVNDIYINQVDATFQGCNIKCTNLNNSSRVDPVLPENTSNLKGLGTVFQNCILDITNYYENATNAYATGDFAIFDECIFTVADFWNFTFAGGGITDGNNYDLVENPVSTGLFDYQAAWSAPLVFTSALSAVSASNTNYVDSDWCPITVDGIPTQRTAFPNTDLCTWFNGRRDGVGSIYFEEVSPLISASPTGTVGTPAVMTFNIQDNIVSGLSASEVSYYYAPGEGSDLSANTTSAEHTFVNPGTYITTVETYPYNRWYNNNDDVQLETSATVVSASFQFISLDDFTTPITSAYISEIFIISATNEVSGATQYNFDYGDGSSATFGNGTAVVDIDGLTGPYTYPNPNKYDVILYTNLGQVNETSFSASFFVYPYESSAFYTDINETYTSTGTGTELDPLNWTQFNDALSSTNLIDYPKDSTFYLRGYRQLGNAQSVNRLLTSANPSKNFTIDSWSLSANGPWTLASYDFCAQFPENFQQSEIRFPGTNLKNGIIYNMPYEASSDFGGIVEFTNLNNMYIVNQGVGSSAIVNPYNLITSAVSVPTNPVWITLPPGETFINEEWQDGLFDAFWDVETTSNYTISAYPGSTTDYLLVEGSTTETLISEGTPICGGFTLEWRIRTVTDINGSHRIDLISSLPASQPTYAVTSGCFLYVNETQGLVWKWPNLSTIKHSNASVMLQAGEYIDFKLQRVAGTNEVSAFANYNGAGLSGISDPFPLNDDICFWALINGESGTSAGFEFFHFQSDSGFPYEYSTDQSYSHSVYNVSGTSTILASTLYLDNGMKEDVSTIAATPYTIRGPGGTDITDENYNLRYDFCIEDSVVKGLSATRNEMNNAHSNFRFIATQDSYGTVISAFSASLNDAYTYNPKFVSLQYDYFQSNYNSNWPFTKDTDEFGTHISAIDVRRVIPFDGIQLPPNPGKGHPDYDSYPTGLWEWSRPDYERRKAPAGSNVYYVDLWYESTGLNGKNEEQPLGCCEFIDAFTNATVATTFHMRGTSYLKDTTTNFLSSTLSHTLMSWNATKYGPWRLILNYGFNAINTSLTGGILATVSSSIYIDNATDMYISVLDTSLNIYHNGNIIRSTTTELDGNQYMGYQTSGATISVTDTVLGFSSGMILETTTSALSATLDTVITTLTDESVMIALDSGVDNTVTYNDIVYNWVITPMTALLLSTETDLTKFRLSAPVGYGPLWAQ